jgi:rRNA maturation protein Nop10
MQPIGRFDLKKCPHCGHEAAPSNFVRKGEFDLDDYCPRCGYSETLNQSFGSGQGCLGVFVATLLLGMVGAAMACARLQA